MLVRWRSASLRTHLMVLLIFTIGIILIAIIFTSIQAINDTTREALQEREVIVQLMASNLDAQLQHAVHMLHSALNSELMDMDDGSIEPEKILLKSVYDHAIIFKRINLVDIYGNVIWVEPYEDYMEGINIAQPPYNFPLPQDGKPKFVTSIGLRSQKPGTAIILPIMSPGGGTSGYLYGWLDFSDPRAASLLFTYEPGTQGYSELIDNRGMVLFSTEQGREGQTSVHENMIAGLVSDQRVSVGTCDSCHSFPDDSQQDYVMAFAPLTTVPWGVVMYQPEVEVFTNTYALAARLGGLALVVLIVSAGAVLFTTNGIVRPIREISRSCERIAAGDYSEPVQASGFAETNTLANSFEQMRTALIEYRSQTEAARANLENKVAERTAELVQYRDYLVRANRNLNELNGMAALLIHSLDLSETLTMAIDRILKILQAEAGGIYLLDEQESALVLVAHKGLPQAALPAISLLACQDRAGIRPFTTKEFDESSCHAACKGHLSQGLPGFELVYVPLRAKEAFAGSLFVGSEHLEQFTDEQMTLLDAIGWQIAMAVRNARLYQAVQLKEKEQAAILHLAIGAQEEERKRVARELHDETSQALAAMLLGLDTLEVALKNRPDEAAAMQASIKEIARQMLEDIRRITTDLRPSLLDDMGLIPAISWYGDQRLKPLGISLELEKDGIDGRLPVDMEVALFRIVQEAFTNVIRHAHASRVELQFEHREHDLIVRVSDDGCGFETHSRQSKDISRRRLGLHGMRERAEILGGHFTLQSAPGEGTQITVCIPLPSEGENDVRYPPDSGR
jgi:signal transduction histidine kinase